MASIAAALPESQGTDTEAITVVEPPSFVALTELVKEVHGRDGAILTENFLDLNRKLLPVLDQFGTGFTFVRADIKGNIDRLNRAYQKDPQKFHNLFEIVLDEVARGQDGLRDSDTKGLLWLKRAMEFLIGLLQGLYNDRNMTVLAAAEASYAEYLKPFHGYITYGAFCVALKFVPSREVFMEKLAIDSEEKYTAMHEFLQAFKKVTAEVHQFLVEHNLNDPTQV